MTNRWLGSSYWISGCSGGGSESSWIRFIEPRISVVSQLVSDATITVFFYCVMTSKVFPAVTSCSASSEPSDLECPESVLLFYKDELPPMVYHSGAQGCKKFSNSLSAYVQYWHPLSLHRAVWIEICCVQCVIHSQHKLDGAPLP